MEPNFDFDKCAELTKNGKWFSQLLYDRAYDIIKDDCFPIVIPSYNRPKNKLLRMFKNNNIDNYNFQAYYLVRESQKEEYEAEVVNIKNVHIITAPDDLINGAGKARIEIIKRFNGNIFLFDDDIQQVCFTTPTYTPKGGCRFGTKYNPTDLFKILSMWQLTYMVVKEKYPEIVGSNLPCTAHTWPVTPNHLPQYSVEFNRGPFAVLTICDVDKLKENNLTYRDNSFGHEDLDLQFRCLMAGLKFIRINFIGYVADPPNPEFNGDKSASAMERYEKQYNQMLPYFKDVPWIKTREQKGLKMLAVDYRKYSECMGADPKINPVKLLQEKYPIFNDIETVELYGKTKHKLDLF